MTWPRMSVDRDKGHAVGVEQVHQLGEVGERPGQAVDLVDHHHVDQTGPDVLQQPFEGLAVRVAPREAPVVIGLLYEEPAFVLLTLYIGFSRLPLGTLQQGRDLGEQMGCRFPVFLVP